MSPGQQEPVVAASAASASAAAAAAAHGIYHRLGCEVVGSQCGGGKSGESRGNGEQAKTEGLVGLFLMVTYEFHVGSKRKVQIDLFLNFSAERLFLSI